MCHISRSVLRVGFDRRVLERQEEEEREREERLIDKKSRKVSALVKALNCFHWRQSREMRDSIMARKILGRSFGIYKSLWTSIKSGF